MSGWSSGEQSRRWAAGGVRVRGRFTVLNLALFVLSSSVQIVVPPSSVPVILLLKTPLILPPRYTDRSLCLTLTVVMAFPRPLWSRAPMGVVPMARASSETQGADRGAYGKLGRAENDGGGGGGGQKTRRRLGKALYSLILFSLLPPPPPSLSARLSFPSAPRSVPDSPRDASPPDK